MKIVGIGVCGPGEAQRYMKRTLDEFKRLCDEVVIATCNATEEEKNLISDYGFERYEDNREWGYHQPNIKTDLLKRVRILAPNWIIALDMDEVFAPEFTRKKAEELAKTTEIGYNFMIVNLYNDPEHFAHDAGIQRFWNIRYYKYLPEYGLEFQNKALHCGLAPPYIYKYAWHAPYYVEHYGLMKKEDRDRKAQRYQYYDPRARYKGKVYYDDLQKTLKAIPFDRQGLLRKLAEIQDTQPRKTPKIIINNKPMGFTYIRRFIDGKDMGIVDIPDDQVENLIKNNPSWVILHKVGEDEGQKVEVPPVPEKAKFECSICGRVLNSKPGLGRHMQSHK